MAATGEIQARQFRQVTFSCRSWRPSAGGYQVLQVCTQREPQAFSVNFDDLASATSWTAEKITLCPRDEKKTNKLLPEDIEEVSFMDL